MNSGLMQTLQTIVNSQIYSQVYPKYRGAPMPFSVLAY